MAQAQQLDDVQIQGIHATSRIDQVPLDQLRADRSYQREPSQRMVDDIMEDWNVVASELILVSYRGERDDPDVSGYWIVNGQHRSLAARRLGHETIWARVIDLSEVEDPAAIEAALRLKTNKRLGDRPLERFKAQRRSGDPESLAIVEVLSRFDTEINETPQPDSGINAVVAIETIFRYDNTGGLLQETLELIRDSFGRVGGKIITQPVMKSLAWVLVIHTDDRKFDKGHFINRIRGAGPAALERRARTIQSDMGGSLWMNYYRAEISFFNERLADSNKLDYLLRGAQAKLGRSSSAEQEKRGGDSSRK